MTNRRAPEPFWTVQNGKIGTAHTNRMGVMVNFRPTPFRPVPSQRGGEPVLELPPPGGIEIARLVIACEEVREILEACPTCHRIKFTWSGSFEGVAAVWSEERWETLQTPEAIAIREAKRRAIQEELERVETEKRRFEALLAAASFEELAALAKPTHRELGRLTSPRTGRRQFSLGALLERARVALNANPAAVKEGSAERPTFFERFLQFASAEHARKKAAFAASAVAKTSSATSAS